MWSEIRLKIFLKKKEQTPCFRKACFKRVPHIYPLFLQWKKWNKSQKTLFEARLVVPQKVLFSIFVLLFFLDEKK